MIPEAGERTHYCQAGHTIQDGIGGVLYSPPTFFRIADQRCKRRERGRGVFINDHSSLGEDNLYPRTEA